ncbi:MAG TPA: twin-arginine translocation pathway signal protein [Thermoanaerobaculia bacterium]|jgi:catechol 1,2-dioxygenase|nr:twin-arginine translocation pathway signal protein [Thermoanaerobaculia bacterium]
MANENVSRRSILARVLALPAALALAGREARAEDACAPTESDFKGPMYLAGAPRRTALAGPKEPGERLRIRGTVVGPDCSTPLPRTLLDVWQADAQGEYHWKDEDFRLRGQILTNERGEYELETIKPAGYGGRPAHIHFTISAPGHAPLTTQLYFRGDPRLDHDVCGAACNSDDPHRIIELAKEAKGLSGTFDVVMTGTRA